MSRMKVGLMASAAVLAVGIGTFARGQAGGPEQSTPAFRKHMLDMQRVSLMANRIGIIQSHANKLGSDQADLLAELNGPHESRHKRRVTLLSGIMKERIVDIREQIDAMEQELETLDRDEIEEPQQAAPAAAKPVQKGQAKPIAPAEAEKPASPTPK